MNKKGNNLKLDSDAKSDNDNLPAFLSKPENAPPYHGFPLIKDSEIDGWIYGAITEYLSDEGCESGDGYVQSPDGKRAGLVWETGDFKTETIIEPEKDRWGVYSVSFPKPIFNQDDLIFCFRHILPELEDIYNKNKAANNI